jgi:hypothetical protein
VRRHGILLVCLATLVGCGTKPTPVREKEGPPPPYEGRVRVTRAVFSPDGKILLTNHELLPAEKNSKPGLKIWNLARAG